MNAEQQLFNTIAQIMRERSDTAPRYEGFGNGGGLQDHTVYTDQARGGMIGVTPMAAAGAGKKKRVVKKKVPVEEEHSEEEIVAAGKKKKAAPKKKVVEEAEEIEVVAAGRRKKKAPAVGGKAKKVNPWLTHLDAFRKKHPNLSLSDAMTKAKETYKK